MMGVHISTFGILDGFIFAPASVIDLKVFSLMGDKPVILDGYPAAVRPSAGMVGIPAGGSM